MQDQFETGDTNHYNSGPIYTPYMQSAPPFINTNPTGTEVIIAQPQSSGNFSSYNDRTNSNNPATPSNNGHLTVLN